MQVIQVTDKAAMLILPLEYLVTIVSLCDGDDECREEARSEGGTGESEGGTGCCRQHRRLSAARTGQSTLARHAV